ncbi:hypothetical protein ACVIHI_006668 [Bradyrhizobium sp. USDA 4524]|uniref:hypothetical protein n=1 Tax=unclassified Bradyrhizobium TaxID=2631580 RepID=UPI00209CD404|nr:MULTISPECIES: hypothetical protein [unclassified Bradyrhizobium]MCP1840412.1 hypothetical protein [Bradyrhizobium sp. USDA 4538]MCP1900976.1 hypothetical protein [Bradyrhizobium sp. USDA 4537]MCP1993369.1 hypothetical protein [Bradyrhizobium sp. USDA 4539]
MTKAVFTSKVTPSYKDLPEERYHFPRTYLNYVQQTVGDYIVYYEPRRSSSDLSSRGGRQSYFGVARVSSVIEDVELPDHYFAIIDGATYLDFDTVVPFQEQGEYYESALEKDDGSTNKERLVELYGSSPIMNSTGSCELGLRQFLARCLRRRRRRHLDILNRRHRSNDQLSKWLFPGRFEKNHLCTVYERPIPIDVPLQVCG